MDKFPTDLYLIFDPESVSSTNPNELIRDAISGGVRLIQYRDKRGSKQGAYETVMAILELIQGTDTLLIINDDVDLVLVTGAHGVHLGQEDLPVAEARTILKREAIVGGSAHTQDQALELQEAGADYVGIGPVFKSPTKQARAPLGPEFLAQMVTQIHIPVFAIGGIHMNNVESVLRAGADGVACASAILSSSDVRETCHQMVSLIRRTKESESV